MPEINNNYNLDAHYTKEAKVKRPEKKVATPPLQVPNTSLNIREEAHIKVNQINNDIYEKTQEIKGNPRKDFAKVFGGIVLTILAAVGINKLFKK